MHLDPLQKTEMLSQPMIFLGGGVERILRAQLVSFVWVYNFAAMLMFMDSSAEQGFLSLS